MNIGYMTDRGRRRPTNEDSLRACEDLSFFMLADGVGGNRSGEIASQSALDALEKFVRHNPPEWLGSRDEVFRYFRAAVNYVNQFIIKLSEAKLQYTGMATTLTFAYIRDDEMYVANVGDSRLYVLHPKAAHDLTGPCVMKQITEDHSLVETMVRTGEIKREDARNHPNKNVITRALGAGEDVEVDYFEVDVTEGDLVLLCSDGLTNMVEDEDIMQIIRDNGDLISRTTKELIKAANRNGGKDNIGIVLVRL